MPIYTWLCNDCGVVTETSRKIAEIDAPYTCPECGSKDTSRQLAATAVQMPSDGSFRGSGRAEMDKRIGADAEMRREYYRGEMEKKNAVRQAAGQREIGRTRDGEYKPLSQGRLAEREGKFKEFEHAKKTGRKVVHDE